jgi:hypothetical protein
MLFGDGRQAWQGLAVGALVAGDVANGENVGMPWDAAVFENLYRPVASGGHGEPLGSRGGLGSSAPENVERGDPLFTEAESFRACAAASPPKPQPMMTMRGRLGGTEAWRLVTSAMTRTVPWLITER